MLGMLGTMVWTGCSGRNQIEEMFAKDRLYEKALIYTREDQIVREFETKANVSATLLNELFPDRFRYDDGVYFFFGIVTDLSVEKIKKDYNLTMNGEEPVAIEKVKSDDDLYKLMPNVNRWGRYYLVKFPPDEAKKYVIKFSVYPYDPIELRFSRPSVR